MKITIYTDGSSRGNPGPGGWAAILIAEKQAASSKNQEEFNPLETGVGDEVLELGGREDMTTNNRMELLGAIEGLKEVDGKKMSVQDVEVKTDSQYVKKGMSEWIDGWIQKNWKNSQKKDVLNRDLWEALKKEEDRLKGQGVKVIWSYVPGHAGVALNERADVIATTCADNAEIELYRGPKSDYPYEM